jgi:hypothetical protein
LSGFWHVKIKEEHKERTGLTVPSGHFEFNRLPFGLSNSPANSQRLMDLVLKDLIGDELHVFVDDIFSKTAKEHAARLEHVLERFDKSNLQLHPQKCTIARPQVNYLEYVLSQDGISASPDKVKAVRNYPTPTNVKDVRAFLGLASFYRRLVPEFAKLSKHLTILIKKDHEFTWSPSQQEAFEKLKVTLCTTPVLAYPDFSQSILTTDASKIAIAVILSQVREGVERPLAYASRQLTKAESVYSASETEMLALMWAAKHFRCYLYGRKFVVRTDHAALTYLKNFADQNARLKKWSMKLSGLQFTVEHRAGGKIPHADALSRHVGTIRHEVGLSPEVVGLEQAKDPCCQRLNPGTYSDKCEFFLDDQGLIYRRRPNDQHQLLVPKALVNDVIRENHSPIFIAHPGVKRTCDLIVLNFWWPGMRRSIEEYIKGCDGCQRRKEDREFKAPLGEVEVPVVPFQVTSMDITGPYPLTPHLSITTQDMWRPSRSRTSPRRHVQKFMPRRSSRDTAQVQS